MEAALQTLVAFLRKTHGSSVRWHGSSDLNLRLLAFSQGWGVKELVSLPRSIASGHHEQHFNHHQKLQRQRSDISVITQGINLAACTNSDETGVQHVSIPSLSIPDISSAFHKHSQLKDKLLVARHAFLVIPGGEQQ